MQDSPIKESEEGSGDRRAFLQAAAIVVGAAAVGGVALLTEKKKIVATGSKCLPLWVFRWP